MYRLEFTSECHTTDEIVDAIDELKRMVEGGFTSTGHWMSNGNEGGFSFSLTEKEEPVEEPDVVHVLQSNTGDEEVVIHHSVEEFTAIYLAHHNLCPEEIRALLDELAEEDDMFDYETHEWVAGWVTNYAGKHYKEQNPNDRS